MKMKKLLLLLNLISYTLLGQLNETEVSSYIQGLTAVHTESAYKSLMDGVINESMVKKKDVINSKSVGSSTTLDYSIYDAFSVTHVSTATMSYTISGLVNGQVGYLSVTKPSTGKINFITGTVLYPENSSNYNNATSVLFKVVQKIGITYIIPEGYYCYTPATETIKGVVEKATTAEAQAGTAEKYLDAALLQTVTSTTTRKGIVEKSTVEEALSGTIDKFIDAEVFSNARAGVNIVGSTAFADLYDANLGVSTNLAINPYSLKDVIDNNNEAPTWIALTLQSPWSGTLYYAVCNNGKVKIRGTISPSSNIGLSNISRIAYISSPIYPLTSRAEIVIGKEGYFGESGADGGLSQLLIPYETNSIAIMAAPNAITSDMTFWFEIEYSIE